MYGKKKGKNKLRQIEDLLVGFSCPRWVDRQPRPGAQLQRAGANAGAAGQRLDRPEQRPGRVQQPARRERALRVGGAQLQGARVAQAQDPAARKEEDVARLQGGTGPVQGGPAALQRDQAPLRRGRRQVRAARTENHQERKPHRQNAGGSNRQGDSNRQLVNKDSTDRFPSRKLQ